MHATSLHSLAYRRFARNSSLLCYCSCGEVNARSLQDNSKIRAFLLLLMSGGRSCDQFDPYLMGQGFPPCPVFLLP